MKKRHSIIYKTVQIGIGTLLSRLTGFVRRVLMIRFLPMGAVSDAFNVAFVLANTMRKIFADGAMSAAMSPTLVSVMRNEGKHQASALVTLTFAFLQTFLVLLCVFLSFNSTKLIYLAAPGFDGNQAAMASSFSSILIFYIVFVSAAALFASALQSVNRFFVAAYSPVLMNILTIIQLAAFLYYKANVYALAWATLANGFIIALMHIIAYKHAGFSFAFPDKSTFRYFGAVLKKFLPCLLSVGGTEISFFIDRMMASYLPTGSVSVLDYVWAFMGVPLGVLITAFAAVILPQMSTLGLYARDRLGFYLLESAKLVAWTTLPIAAVMAFFSHEIFYTTLYSENFSIFWVDKAAALLIVFSCGLFFFSINKILLNVSYALHDTFKPTLISFASAFFNTILNVILMKPYGVMGIAAATVIAEIAKTIGLLFMLSYVHGVKIYLARFFKFCASIILYISILAVPFYIGYKALYALLISYKYQFFIDKIGFWLWVGPLCLLFAGCFYIIQKKMGQRMFFLH